ncbi:MAG: hypothetical protein AB7S26_34470 [Sandaracinaceae bacterium]
MRSAALGLALLLVACDPASDPDAGTDASVDAGAMDAGTDASPPGCDAGADPFSCESLERDPSCGAAGAWVVGVSGQVVDDTGAPIEGAFTQLCLRSYPDDALTCLAPPMTAVDGSFAIVIPEAFRCLSRAVMRVLAPTRPLGTTYCPVEFAAGTEGIVALDDPFVLYAVSPPAGLPDPGDLTMPREIAFADGLKMTFAPDDLSLSTDYADLASGVVGPSATECFAAPGALDGAYVFWPETSIEGGTPVSIPNTGALAPGTVVDLFVLGGLQIYLLDGTLLEEAELATIGTATVSTDGASIDSDVGTLVPALNWLAWKAR